MTQFPKLSSPAWIVPSDKDLHVALAGHFDPSEMAPLVGGKEGHELSKLTGPTAVPIHHLARELVKRGIQTTLIGGLPGSVGLNVRSSSLSVVAYGKRGRKAWIATGLRRERLQLLDHLIKLQPSIVHAHWTMEAARAVSDWAGPKVLTVHDAAGECARIAWDWNWGPLAHASNLRWLANTSAVLRRFSHVIAVSPFVESYLRLKYRFGGEIRVIPNAIPPLPDTVRIVNSFPKTDRITFGAYGNPGRLKNVSSAIEAFRHVHCTVPNSRLVVFGTGWAGKYRGHPNLPIEFRGAVPHSQFISTLAADVDIWVHPSRIEAHPIVVCEAIQAGCSVIAGRCSGGTAWTLDYGKSSLLIDIEQPSKIAEAMLALVHERAMASDLIAYGRRMICERFSPEKVIDMHLQYYADVVRDWKHGTR